MSIAKWRCFLLGAGWVFWLPSCKDAESSGALDPKPLALEETNKPETDLPEAGPDQPAGDPAKALATTTRLPVAEEFIPYLTDNPPPCMVVSEDGSWSLYDGEIKVVAPERSPLPGQDALENAIEEARQRDEVTGMQGEVFLSASADLAASEFLEMYLTCLRAGLRNVFVMVQNPEGEESALEIPIGPSVALEEEPIVIRLAANGEVATGLGGDEKVVSDSVGDRRLEGLDQPIRDYLAALQARNENISAAYVRSEGGSLQRLVDVLVRLQAHKIVHLHPNDEMLSFDDTGSEPESEQVRPGTPRRIIPPPVRPRKRPLTPVPDAP